MEAIHFITLGHRFHSCSSASLGFFMLNSRRFLFSPAPLQSFTVTNKQFHAAGSDALAPRPYQGLDMRKIHQHKWISPFVTRVPFKSGYQYDRGRVPSVNACTHAEIASFFDVENVLQKYTWRQIAASMAPQLRWAGMMLSAVLITTLPIVCVVFYHQKYEPLEHQMPRDEYFKNFKWNYFGPELDHHAYEQYAEARRARKWRNVDVDPEQWIPPKYRGAWE